MWLVRSYINSFLSAYLLTILQDLELVGHAALLVGRGDPSTLLAHMLSKVHLARFT